MTEITPQEAIKTKANFSNFISKLEIPEIENVLKEYPQNYVVVDIPELTQNIDSLLNVINEMGDITPYIVWIVANEKENLMKVAKFFNKCTIKNVGIFVFKASLTGDKMEFNCILKPDKKSLGNNFTYAKEIQNKYWQKYFEICDEIGSDMQVSPKYQHWQYLGMGKKGVGLMLSVSTKLKYIGADLIINYNKFIYEKLLLNKEAIEKELGELEWINISDNKSSKIRKTLDYDVTDENQVKKAIKEHIKLAESFKATFSKYL